MATWQDFALQSVQTSIFTPDHGAFTSSRAAAIILRNFGERYAGELQALPLPLELPPELPRLGLQSGDGQWRLSMGPARIDSAWTSVDGSQNGLRDVAMTCFEPQERYLRESGIRAGRIGLVVRRICPCENPSEMLIQRFCSEASRQEPFNRSSKFEIHNHKVYTPHDARVDYPINSWVRCKSAATGPEDHPAVQVVQDLNTSAKDLSARRFDADRARAFFEVVVVEAQEILRKYFPEGKKPCP